VFVYADTEIKGIIYNVIKDAVLYYCSIASSYYTSYPGASAIKEACLI
jgi:hypothetical protein